MTQSDRIRLRPDGSIDTAYYMAAGRRHRSEAAHRMFGAEPQSRETRTHRPKGFFSRLF